MIEDSNTIYVYIDPWDIKLLDNNLFRNTKVNDVRKPFVYLFEYCKHKNITLLTADKIPNEENRINKRLYYSFGQLNGYRKIKNRKDIKWCSFYLFEPPIKVLPRKTDIYYGLPHLFDIFKRVFTTCPVISINECYNTNYQFSTSSFCYPQAHDNIIDSFWKNDDRKLLVMVNSYRYSRLRSNEYYSERINALNYFLPKGLIDLFGNDWDKLGENFIKNFGITCLWSIKHFNLRRLKDLIKTFKNRKYFKNLGSSENKYSTLAKYRFAICFESMGIEGFITEKIFDCFFTGTIPIYLGALNINTYIPKDSYIDKRDFKNYEDLHKFIIGMSEFQYESYRNSIKEFLSSEKYKPFTMKIFAENFVADVLNDYAQQ